MKGKRACLSGATAVVVLTLGARSVDAADPLTCHGRPATYVGTEGADRIDIKGNAGQVIVALGGDDFIKTRAGKDVVCGGNGDDSINTGGSREDRAFGGAGNDTIILAELARGEGDDDSLTTIGFTKDDLDGGAGNDFISAAGRPDVIAGGNDALDGGDGVDFCGGNSGIDTAVDCEATLDVP